MPSRAIGEVLAINDSGANELLKFITSSFDPAEKFIKGKNLVVKVAVQSLSASVTNVAVSGGVSIIEAPATLSTLRSDDPVNSASNLLYNNISSVQADEEKRFLTKRVWVGSNIQWVNKLMSSPQRISDPAPDSGNSVLVNIDYTDAYSVAGNIVFPVWVDTNVLVQNPGNSYTFFSDYFNIDVPPMSSVEWHGSLAWSFSSDADSVLVSIAISFENLSDTIEYIRTVSQQTYFGLTGSANLLVIPYSGIWDPVDGTPHRTVWRARYAVTIINTNNTVQTITTTSTPTLHANHVLPLGKTYGVTDSPLVISMTQVAVGTAIQITVETLGCYEFDPGSAAFVTNAPRFVDYEACQIFDKITSNRSLFNLPMFYEQTDMENYSNMVKAAVMKAGFIDTLTLESWKMMLEASVACTCMMIQRKDIHGEASIRSNLMGVGKLVKKGIKTFGDEAKPIANKAMSNLVNVTKQHADELITNGAMALATGNFGGLVNTGGKILKQTIRDTKNDYYTPPRIAKPQFVAATNDNWKIIREQLSATKTKDEAAIMDLKKKGVTIDTRIAPASECYMFPCVAASEGKVISQLFCVTKEPRTANQTILNYMKTQGQPDFPIGFRIWKVLEINDVKNELILCEPTHTVGGRSIEYAVHALAHSFNPIGCAFSGAIQNGFILPIGNELLFYKEALCVQNKLMLLCNKTTKPVKLEKTVPIKYPKLTNVFMSGNEVVYTVNKDVLCTKFPVIFEHKDLTLAEKDGSVVGLCIILQDDPAIIGFGTQKNSNTPNKHVVRNYDGYVNQNIPYDLVLMYIIGITDTDYNLQMPDNKIKGHSLDYALSRYVELQKQGTYDAENNVYSGAIIRDSIRPLPNTVFSIKKEFCLLNHLNLITKNELSTEPESKIKEFLSDFIPANWIAKAMDEVSAIFIGITSENDQWKGVVARVVSDKNIECSKENSTTLDGSIHSHFGSVFKIKTGGNVRIEELKDGKWVLPQRSYAGRCIALALECMCKNKNNFAFVGDVYENKILPTHKLIADAKLKACRENDLSLVANSSVADYNVKKKDMARRLTYRKGVSFPITGVVCMDIPPTKTTTQTTTTTNKNKQKQTPKPTVKYVPVTPAQKSDIAAKQADVNRPKFSKQQRDNLVRMKIAGNKTGYNNDDFIVAVVIRSRNFMLRGDPASALLLDAVATARESAEKLNRNWFNSFENKAVSTFIKGEGRWIPIFVTNYVTQRLLSEEAKQLTSGDTGINPYAATGAAM